MAYEPKDMTFKLFPNDYKESDTQPDYKGNGKVSGRIFKISGWIDDTKDGSTKYISGKMEWKEKYLIEEVNEKIEEKLEEADEKYTGELEKKLNDKIPF